MGTLSNNEHKQPQRVGSPANGIVTKTVHKTLPRGGGDQGGGWVGVQGWWGSRGWWGSKGWWRSKGGGSQGGRWQVGL